MATLTARIMQNLKDANDTAQELKLHQETGRARATAGDLIQEIYIAKEQLLQLHNNPEIINPDVETLGDFTEDQDLAQLKTQHQEEINSLYRTIEELKNTVQRLEKDRDSERKWKEANYTRATALKRLLDETRAKLDEKIEVIGIYGEKLANAYGIIDALEKAQPYSATRTPKDREIIINHALEMTSSARIIAKTEHAICLQTKTADQAAALRFYLEDSNGIRCFYLDALTIRASLDRDHRPEDVYTEQR